MAGRKLTEREKARRAKTRLEAKDRAELGPLFAAQVETIDETVLLHQRRMGHARSVVHLRELLGGIQVLDTLYARQLEALARQHVPSDVCDRLATSWRDRSPELQVSAWLSLLRGEEHLLGVKEECGPPRRLGLRVISKETWPPPGWKAPYTKLQTDTLFWRKCNHCGWHAPEQVDCGPPLRDGGDPVLNALGALRTR